jgi:hypothetical protein
MERPAFSCLRKLIHSRVVVEMADEAGSFVARTYSFIHDVQKVRITHVHFQIT